MGGLHSGLHISPPNPTQGSLYDTNPKTRHLFFGGLGNSFKMTIYFAMLWFDALPKWVFPKIGVFPPKWMVKIMENPINKWMIWGGKTPLFSVQHPKNGSHFNAPPKSSPQIVAWRHLTLSPVNRWKMWRLFWSWKSPISLKKNTWMFFTVFTGDIIPWV